MSWQPLERTVQVIAEVALDRRGTWDRLDAAVGDGDFGTSLARGFSVVRTEWEQLDRATPEAFLKAVAHLLGREIGGSSGPLLSVAFSRAGEAAGSAERVDVPLASRMLQVAADGIAEYGRSGVGDKTLLDALVPAAKALADAAAQGAGDPGLAWTAVAEAAAEGAASTRSLLARRGRAVYSAERNLGAPDPGAVAVAVVAARLAGEFGYEAPDVADLEVPAVEVPAEEAGAAGGEGDGSESREAAPAGAEQTRALYQPLPTKKFLNDPDQSAIESLVGLAKASPDLVVWETEERIVRRSAPLPPGRVGLISGGGSGHEPLHAGFVGFGMLTAVAPGPVFASPTTAQILAATRAAHAGGGVLHIVKNYTGDVLNFRLAAEAAGAEGIEVASVLVDDDVAVDGSAYTIGRRGTGATVFVHKLAGALADFGAPLEEVRQLAERVVRRSASFGIALTSSSPPGAGPILQLGPDEIEVGVGIHGERGRRRDRLRVAAELVAESEQLLVSALQLQAGDRVLAMVNGFGGTPLMELYLLFNDLHDRLSSQGITVARNLVGNYVTSLDMAGASFTLLALDPQLESLWDAPVHTPALRWGR
ncbi:MAG: dihydroxyacetone kinase subunit DhaK [Acidimicrobiaceae bacterium]|nr:dihydroxyacetone kinase subunit DhaK [Acidimicrobiaceae bacterium]